MKMMKEKEDDEVVCAPLLFETKEARFRGSYKVFASTILVSISLILFYRVTNIPTTTTRTELWAWIALLVCEILFGLYWIITQSVRWRIAFHSPSKHTLLQRFDEEKMPAVDIFVCTADPILEPPLMVINTILSAMAYNYPSNKLSVYLSDDGGSELTFYALFKASIFSKHWLPFCRRFNVQTRSPQAYFSGLNHNYSPNNTTNNNNSHHDDDEFHKQWLFIKKLYEEMKSDIETTLAKGKVAHGERTFHKGFAEWTSKTKKQDHHSIVQIIIDGRDKNAVDEDGIQLPRVVYMAREKRPNYPHHFKAGAMNALIRVSSEISNGPLILNLDCDMYPSNADTIQETLCFFMDESRGQNIAYVQFPQNYNNLTKNDHYANSCLATDMIELAGISGHGAALYCGTGCFHRRESLSGAHFKDYKAKLDHMTVMNPKIEDNRTVHELNEASKVLATCTYEHGTLWGKEMGLVYGIPVEDIASGLVMTCRGWKSIYYNPERKAFMGVAPTTLDVALVQHKRWSEGMFQVFLSKYCPFIYGHGKINIGIQMGYCVYLLWAPLSLPTLCYSILPSLCLIRGIPLFPQPTSLWFLPFAYAFVANNGYSLCEALSCGSTIKAWLNLQRMRFIRRTTSHFFGFIDTITKQLGLSQTNFVITDKVVTDQDVQKRYEKEIIDFGGCSSTMLTILVTLALINLLGFLVGIKRIIMGQLLMIIQIVLSSMIVMVNLPVYEALFIRSDKGSISSNVMIKSFVLASLACFIAIFVL